MGRDFSRNLIGADWVLDVASFGAEVASDESERHGNAEQKEEENDEEREGDGTGAPAAPEEEI